MSQTGSRIRSALSAAQSNILGARQDTRKRSIQGVSNYFQIDFQDLILLILAVEPASSSDEQPAPIRQKRAGDLEDDEYTFSEVLQTLCL